MKALVKKWIIRLLIVELIANIALFTITPYLFGLIKPFNMQVRQAKVVKVVTRTGVLKKLGQSIYIQGSYVLKSKGKTSLIESKKSLDKYVGKEVAVKGTVKKSVEGLYKIIDGPTVDKRLDVITVTSISSK